ncbi:unnamed protein product [Withania somnifera]
MDMHINMSYCTPSGFKILASNYLGLKNHCKFVEIEELITEFLNKKKEDCKEKVAVENEMVEKGDEMNKEEMEIKKTRKRKGNSRRGRKKKA